MVIPRTLYLFSKENVEEKGSDELVESFKKPLTIRIYFMFRENQQPSFVIAYGRRRIINFLKEKVGHVTGEAMEEKLTDTRQ